MLAERGVLGPFFSGVLASVRARERLEMKDEETMNVQQTNIKKDIFHERSASLSGRLAKVI